MPLIVSPILWSALWESFRRRRRRVGEVRQDELIGHCKSHVLSVMEYRTPAIYHESTTSLRPVDQILRSFLRQLGVSGMAALVHFNLAPLSSRRDIPMLGLIHRTLLGLVRLTLPGSSGWTRLLRGNLDDAMKDI